MSKRGSVETFENFLRRYGLPSGPDGPVRLVEDVFKVSPDPWQKDVLREYGRLGRRISVRSCHGPGKTALAAWLVWANLLTRFPQKTVATAPSAAQLDSALLPEISKWGNMLPAELQGLFESKTSTIAYKPRPDESFFRARTSRAETPEALQGVHCDPGHVLLIGDEASGIPEPVYISAEGSMSGHNATTILISNPVRTTGMFFDTHHKLRDMWFTRKVGYADSSRVSDDFVEGIRRRFGEDSDEFRVRCLGEFPEGDEDVLIPFGLIETARMNEVQDPPGCVVVWGLDVARYGKDKTALVERTKRRVLPNIQVWGKKSLMETAGRVKAYYDSLPPKQRPVRIYVDAAGMGGGVTDRLQEVGLPAIDVNVGRSATDGERFANVKAELWMSARDWLETGTVALPPADPKADPRTDPVEQLCMELRLPRYTYDSTGKMRMESKDSIRSRGFASPNIADAFVLTFADDISRLSHGHAGGASWGTPITRGIPVW